ncbi:MAG: hypothetical protein LIP00_00795 [Parabacteroides sp.]|nr:hypothetical protein [Parabacteroides sp.]
MNSTSYFSILLIAVASMLTAATVLAILPVTCNDLLLGKRCWLHLSLLFMGGSLLFATLVYPKKLIFRLSVTDVLLVLLALVTGVIYQWNIDASAKFPLCLQLLLLWFMLRTGLSMFPELGVFFISILLCLGCIEALLGITQFFHLAEEKHFLSHLTGSFINSDDYGGYLAMLLPISLYWVLRYGSCRKTDCLDIRTLLFYSALPTLMLIMVILPAVINLVTWLAAILPCIWIAWKCFSWGKLLKKMKRSYSIAFTYALLVVAVAGFITFSGIYISHTIEGDMRLFRYQPTFSLHPADVFEAARFTYFTDITRVVRLPDGVSEINILTLVLVVAIVCSCFYSAYKKGMADICGALIAALIYIVFSFPLLRAPFLVTLTFIGVVSTVPAKTSRPAVSSAGRAAGRFTPFRNVLFPFWVNKAGVVLLIAFLLGGSHWLLFRQKEVYAFYRKWIEETSQTRYEWEVPAKKSSVREAPYASPAFPEKLPAEE